MIRRETTSYRQLLRRFAILSAVALCFNACEDSAMTYPDVNEPSDSNGGDPSDPSNPDPDNGDDKPIEKCTDECSQEGKMRCDA